MARLSSMVLAPSSIPGRICECISVPRAERPVLEAGVRDLKKENTLLGYGVFLGYGV